MENTENKTPKHFCKTLKAGGEMQVSTEIEGLIAEIVFELLLLGFDSTAGPAPWTVGLRFTEIWKEKKKCPW